MTPSMDFLRPPGRPRAGWWFLMVGAGALLVALAFDHRDSAVRDEARRSAEARLELERQRVRSLRVAAPSPVEVRSRQAQFDARALWLPTLRAIEASTRDPVYLRALVIEPSADLVKLEAEAPTFADVLSYVEELDGSERLRPALLSSHEQVADPATGLATIRFSVVTRWNSH